MTDETTTTDPGDDTIEVKWRKKSERPRPATESPAGTAESTPAATADVEALQRELDTERQHVRDLQERWQRAQADLANLRRRTESERGEMEKFASMLLVSEILPVLDNFERALATIPGNLSMLTWIQGVMLIERHLRAILERQGLEPIVAQGQHFSPHLHEAVSEVETEEQAPGTVVREYQKGYTMHGRVIRPSLVEIAKEPERQPADETPAPQETDEETGAEIAEEAETENVGP